LISAINGSGLGITASFGTAANAGTAATAAANAAVNNTTNATGGTDTGIIISGAGIGAGGAAGAASATGADGAGEIGTLTVTNATAAVNADTSVLSGSLSIVGSDGKTHNITLGTGNSTDTLANLATTINAAGYGVTATYKEGSSVTADNIVFTTANSNVTVSQSSAALTGTTTTGANSVALTGTPTATGTQQATTIGSFNVGTSTGAGTITIGTSTIAQGATETSAALAAAINKGNYGVTATLNTLGTAYNLTTTDSSIAALTAASDVGGTGITISAPTGAGTGGASTSSQYYSIGISGTVTDSSTTVGTGNVGITADTNGTGGIATISYSDAAGQSLASTDLSNATDAQATLTALNSAISDVSAQDGYLGAMINTLNSVSSVLSTQSENVTSAQNAVQATDYAAASSNMSKYEILSQTGISALAQANSVQQEVTKLLQ